MSFPIQPLKYVVIFTIIIQPLKQFIIIIIIYY